VPEPDISLHFLIQLLKILNQAPRELIQRLKRRPEAMAGLATFLKQYIGLGSFPDFRPQPKLDFVQNFTGILIC